MQDAIELCPDLWRRNRGRLARASAPCGHFRHEPDLFHTGHGIRLCMLQYTAPSRSAN